MKINIGSIVLASVLSLGLAAQASAQSYLNAAKPGPAKPAPAKPAPAKMKLVKGTMCGHGRPSSCKSCPSGAEKVKLKGKMVMRCK